MEQLGEGSGTEGVEASPKPTLELIPDARFGRLTPFPTAVHPYGHHH
jgi:hypothetical protein